jgi:asparagine synthase (glutamine-hydrolysing)
MFHGNGVTIGHRRLAIIDPAGGAQPLHAASATLAANAEIYNYAELRAALPGTPFATQSDCEPALHLFQKNGPDYVAALRGMYAVAAHDAATGTLHLSRDPFGIKPLYLAELPWGMAFGSTPAALLAAGLARRAVGPGPRAALLNMQFSCGPATIFPGITRLLPGETVHIRDGAATHRTRRPALPDGPVETISEAAALTRLDHALSSSVALHLRADVPCGLLLSGGIDSASILAVMARHARVHAFTAGFDAAGGSDERNSAAAMARAAGARHEAIEIGAADVWRHLPEIVACMDDPAADYAIIPLWFLARHASPSVKVLLSGEGGDELFAGYGRYRHAILPWWRGGRRMRARGIFDGLHVLHDTANWRAGWQAAETAAATSVRCRLQAAQAADIAEWLPNDLLIKLDRCLMAHGIEGRTPLLDQAVADASFRLPDHLKIRGGRGKYLLRAWLARALPAANAHAPKQGFTVPIGPWLAAAGSRLAPLVAARPAVAEIARPDAVRALFEHGRHAKAAWTLLFYALWHHAHIEGRRYEGDVFEVLAER